LVALVLGFVALGEQLVALGLGLYLSQVEMLLGLGVLGLKLIVLVEGLVAIDLIILSLVVLLCLVAGLCL